MNRRAGGGNRRAGGTNPRLLLAASGLAALVLAFPGPGWRGVVLTAAGAIALGRAVSRPGSPAAAVVVGAAVLAWLDGSAGPLRCAALAVALAGVHFAAALAAVVPAGVRAPRQVLLPWLARWMGTSAAGTGAVLATALLPATPAPAATAVAAAVVITATTAAAWWRATGGNGGELSEEAAAPPWPPAAGGR